jgi:hypothetical protein
VNRRQWRNYNGFRPGEAGGPNPNELNGGPQYQAVEQKHWQGRPLICYNVIFWPSEFCKFSPQSPENGISETLDSKIFRVSMPWTPQKLVHIRCSTRAFGTSTRGPFEHFEPGAPWYNVAPLTDVTLDEARAPSRVSSVRRLGHVSF